MIAADANILMELLENRKRISKVQKAIAKYTQEREQFALSTLTVSHVFYLAEAHKISLREVEQLVSQYRIYDVLVADVDWALAHYKGKDFEDALQVAAALREKCTAFMTLDAALSKKYGKFLAIDLIA